MLDTVPTTRHCTAILNLNRQRFDRCTNRILKPVKFAHFVYNVDERKLYDIQIKPYSISSNNFILFHIISCV